MEALIVTYWTNDNLYCWTIDGKHHQEKDQSIMFNMVINAGYEPDIYPRTYPLKMILFKDLSGRGYAGSVSAGHVARCGPDWCGTEEETKELYDYIETAEIGEEFLSTSFKLTCL